MKAKQRDPVDCQTYRLWPDAGQMLGLGRSATYQAADRGDIPTVRVGNLRLVPKGKLHKMLGIEDGAA